MVIVPIIGVILKQKIEINSWIGVGFATIGLYLLCINENFNINYGDLLIIISAFLWAIHILIIDYFLKKVEPLKLSFLQFAVCSIFSIITAAIFEDITIKGISNAIVPILYGGILSVWSCIYLASSSPKICQAFPCSYNFKYGIGNGCIRWRTHTW